MCGGCDKQFNLVSRPLLSARTVGTGAEELSGSSSIGSIKAASIGSVARQVSAFQTFRAL